jgi:hypothetical protein
MEQTTDLDHRVLTQQMIDWQKQREMKNEVQAGFLHRPEAAVPPTGSGLDQYDRRFTKPPPE